ncbi:hypothetical protein [Pseudoglutamicibacter albus]|uniref:DUF2330 domain-containing protein n=1 Tax=Pseudoglutamicibacter albus TaxID=98671 RepID=A0ABU1Z0B7_9MICC|nr:hypothetical protein [Pseudoglutamicibacter albus]MDR7294054.1 hypothetical protein [Pseudoglutamicibacter albus]
MNAFRPPLARHLEANQSRRRWSVLFVVLLALCSLALTACAVDIETSRETDTNGKGTRSMAVAARSAASKTSKSPIYASKISEHGFRNIYPLIEKRADGYRLAVVYRLDWGGEDAEKVREKWIDSAMPEGARRVKPIITLGSGREEIAVVMDVRDDAELQDALRSLLADKNLEVSITELEEPQGLFARGYEYTLETDCSRICGGPPVHVLFPYVSAPGPGTGGQRYIDTSRMKDLGFTEGATFTLLSKRDADNAFRASDARGMNLTSVTAVLKPGAGEKVSFEVSVAVPESELGGGSEKFEEALTPDNGSLTSQKKGEQRVFTFTWEGKDPEELTEKVQATFASFTMSESRKGGLWPETAAYVRFAPEHDLKTTIETTPRLKVELPFMHGVKGEVPGEGYDLTEPHQHVVYSGPSSAWFITMGVLAVVVLAGLAILLVFRKKISAKLK